MKISDQEINKSLSDKLHNIYLVLGEESLQIQEVTDPILSRAKKDEFLERVSYVITKQTDWSFLKSSSENLDLFGSKKILEIKLIGTGPGNAGASALKEYSKDPDPNKVVLITGEGLDKKSHSSAWVKALEEAGILIIISPIYNNQLPAWILETGKKHGLVISREAGAFLASRTEGNLLSALQEIKKLALLYPSQDIGIEEMASSVADSSKFNVFDLSNAFIAGNRKRTATILESLKAEGAPETLVLWSLSREITNLFKVINQGSTQGIWGPRTYLDSLTKSAKLIKKEKVKSALKNIATIDSSIKGQRDQNAWQAIRELILSF